MKAANEAADKAAHALEDMTTEAHRTLPPRPSMAAPEAEMRFSGQENNETAQPLRQLASATTEETQAPRKVLNPDPEYILARSTVARPPALAFASSVLAQNIAVIFPKVPVLQVQDADQAIPNKQTVIATVQPAVDTLPPKVPVVSAASAAPEPDMNSPRPQNIFDLAVGFLHSQTHCSCLHMTSC